MPIGIKRAIKLFFAGVPRTVSLYILKNLQRLYKSHFAARFSFGGSYLPGFLKGLHRSIRNAPKKTPHITPRLLMLSKVYCEQVGRNMQV